MNHVPELVSAHVPVIICTGFLGSGKTTLLQRILRDAHGFRVAAMMNEFEFGKSIEKGLTMQSSETSDDLWVELNNGCLCCSAKAQTVLALEALVARGGGLDLVLIETSGMADPTPIAVEFWQDDALQSVLRFAGIVTLVDTPRIQSYLDKGFIEAQRQLVVADLVLLNKCDLLKRDGTQQISVTEVIRSINPITEIQEVSLGGTNDKETLSESTRSLLQRLLRADITKEATTTQQLMASSQPSALMDSSHDATHPIHTLQLELDRTFVSKRQVEQCYATLLERFDGQEGSPFVILRSKAAVWIGETTCVQVQSVGDTFEVSPMANATAGGLPFGISRFIFFGLNIQQDKIRKHFLSFV